jgi:RNA polymerase sigma-70 factor (ECF subfamily)
MRRDADAAALELFREHGEAVYRFASVLTRHHQDAEDVVQETFLKLLQHLRTSGDTRNVRGWIFTVAANAARDRQRGRLRWLPWTATQEPVVDPAHLRDEDGRIASLRTALQRLAVRDRLLVALRAQGLSYQEIASALDIKSSSVGTLLARAMTRLSAGLAPAQDAAPLRGHAR